MTFCRHWSKTSASVVTVLSPCFICSSHYLQLPGLFVHMPPHCLPFLTRMQTPGEQWPFQTPSLLFSANEMSTVTGKDMCLRCWLRDLGFSSVVKHEWVLGSNPSTKTKPNQNKKKKIQGENSSWSKWRKWKVAKVPKPWICQVHCGATPWQQVFISDFWQALSSWILLPTQPFTWQCENVLTWFWRKQT